MAFKMSFTVLRWAAWLLVAVYIFAVAVLAIGTFGMFGADKDPLSGIFLIPLGMPWLLLLDWMPDALDVASAVLSPLLNIFILFFVARRFGNSK